MLQYIDHACTASLPKDIVETHGYVLTQDLVGVSDITWSGPLVM